MFDQLSERLSAVFSRLSGRGKLSEADVNEALRELWRRHALPEDFEMPVTLCLEEVLSNVIRHGCTPGNSCDIEVRYQIFDGGIEVQVSDNARAFDPLSLPAPDLSAPLEKRQAGGLGVFLVRKMMDEVRYDYRDGRNRFVFRKYWPTPLAGKPG